MKNKHLFWVAILLGSLVSWGQPASAQGVLPDEESPDQWRSTLYVYLWALSMDGTAGIRGNEVEIDASFSDLLEVLDAAISARFESQKGNWGYFLDGMYTKLNPKQNTPVGDVSVDVKSFIGEVGGVYHFQPKVQGIFGLRYQDMNVDLNPPGRTVGGDQDWVDAFVGLRLVPVQTDRWYIWLRGDIGGGDSDTVWNAVFGAGYRFNERWTLGGAYRVLSNDFEQDGFKWDVNYSGLGIALGYTFR